MVNEIIAIAYMLFSADLNQCFIKSLHMNSGSYIMSNTNLILGKSILMII